MISIFSGGRPTPEEWAGVTSDGIDDRSRPALAERGRSAAISFTGLPSCAQRSSIMLPRNVVGLVIHGEHTIARLQTRSARLGLSWPHRR